MNNAIDTTAPMNESQYTPLDISDKLDKKINEYGASLVHPQVPKRINIIKPDLIPTAPPPGTGQHTSGHFKLVRDYNNPVEPNAIQVVEEFCERSSQKIIEVVRGSIPKEYCTHLAPLVDAGRRLFTYKHRGVRYFDGSEDDVLSVEINELLTDEERSNYFRHSMKFDWPENGIYIDELLFENWIDQKAMYDSSACLFYENDSIDPTLWNRILVEDFLEDDEDIAFPVYFKSEIFPKMLLMESKTKDITSLISAISLKFPNLIFEYKFSSQKHGTNSGFKMIQSGEILYESIPQPHTKESYLISLDLADTAEEKEKIEGIIYRMEYSSSEGQVPMFLERKYNNLKLESMDIKLPPYGTTIDTTIDTTVDTKHILQINGTEFDVDLVKSQMFKEGFTQYNYSNNVKVPKTSPCFRFTSVVPTELLFQDYFTGESLKSRYLSDKLEECQIVFWDHCRGNVLGSDYLPNQITFYNTGLVISPYLLDLSAQYDGVIFEYKFSSSNFGTNAGSYLIKGGEVQIKYTPARNTQDILKLDMNIWPKKSSEIEEKINSLN